MGQVCVCCNHQAPIPSIPSVLPKDSPPLRPIVSANSFEVLRVVGAGSFAQVKLAVFKATQTPVAIKVTRKAQVLKAKQVSHVFTEKQVLSLVESPFIVTFLGSFQDSKYLYCTLEYVPGGELFRLLCERTALSGPEAAFYTAEMTMAICDLHAIKCAYRDLKPENVLISASGHIKLTDFGLAKLLAGEERAFTLCCTPEYISPEVINGLGYDETCDWWQLGILLYEMIAGQTPFSSSNPYELYSNILTNKVRFTSAFDETTQDIVSKLLHKDASKRIPQREILKHGFFAEMCWEQVKELRLTPPFIPTLSDPLDSSYFEDFTVKTEEDATMEASLQAVFEGY